MSIDALHALLGVTGLFLAIASVVEVHAYFTRTLPDHIDRTRTNP